MIAERVRQMVEELEVPFETGPIKMTVCAGVAQLNPARGWEEMMRQADAAMYEAKQHGRNRFPRALSRCLLRQQSVQSRDRQPRLLPTLERSLAGYERLEPRRDASTSLRTP